MAQPKQRLSREDWIRAALDAIAEGGLAAVAVEPLAARLGVTKGSFYAHFRNRDALIDAALARWRESHAASLSELNGIDDPNERLERVLLAAVMFSQSSSPSVHVRLLGELQDPRAREAVAAVTQARVKRLTAAYRDLGFDRRRAEVRARLAYAAYVGLLQMAQETPDRVMTKAQIAALMAELRATLLASP